MVSQNTIPSWKSKIKYKYFLDGFIDFLVRPDDMKKLIDRANESIKSNFRAIRLIDKILKSKIN